MTIYMQANKLNPQPKILSWGLKLKEHKPNGVTDADIDKLISYY